MKSNFNDLFTERLDDYMNASDVDIEQVLDELMPLIVFENHPSKMAMAREIIRQRLTTALNSKSIYSFSKGHFVNIEIATEDQLKTFAEKAERDVEAAARRKEKAESFLNQISMAWDENGRFIGFYMPEAVNG